MTTPVTTPTTQPTPTASTTPATPRGRVVVGVDGTESGLRATRFAALAARAAGAELEVLHALPTHLPVGPIRPVDPPAFDDLGNDIVDAATLARVAVPGLSVHPRLVHGSAVRSLVDAAANADLVVLGAQHEGSLAHLWTGRVSLGVGARAACPTVVVPPEWEPDRRRGRVVVGFKEADGSMDALAEAFAEAARRGAELLVVHAWKLPAAYDDIIAARVAEESLRTHADDPSSRSSRTSGRSTRRSRSRSRSGTPSRRGR